MKIDLKKLISICLCIGSFVCVSNVKAETAPGSYGSGYSQWQDSCPSGHSCQSKTFYRYRDVASWGGYSTAKPSDGFYTEGTQYNVSYNQVVTKRGTWSVKGNNLIRTAGETDIESIATNGVTWNFDSISADIDISQYPAWSNYAQARVVLRCNGSDFITVMNQTTNTQENSGPHANDTGSCNGTVTLHSYGYGGDGRNATYVYYGNFGYYYNSNSSGTTGWQWNTSAPSGTTYVSHTTRTVYAAPSSWGSWSSWQESWVGKTTSRDVQTKTFYSYPLTYTVSYNANGGSGTMENSTATYNQPFRTRQNSFSKTGYVFNGWNEKADGSGTAWGLNSSGVYEAGKDWTWSYKNNITLYAQWKIATYTNSVAHWTWGYKNNEGNNGDKRAFNIGNTSFNANYNSTYTMDTSKQTTIPNGFKLRSSFGTSSIDGSWKAYNMGTSVTQQAKGMSYEYDYDPIDYKITYNLNGGTNNSNNPSTYNVLYGVSLKEPTRKGYTFVGWYINGNKVTGINEGANASFSSANDLYTKLASRITGNITIEAKWTTNYIRYTADCLADSNGNIITQENAANSGTNYKTVRKTFDVKETDTNIKNLCVGKYISKQKVSY